MEKAKVYFTDFHTEAFGDSLPTKLKKLILKAGIQELELEKINWSDQIKANLNAIVQNESSTGKRS